MDANEVTIRPAQVGDAKAITRIHSFAIRYTPSVADHYDAEAIEAWSSGIEERIARVAQAVMDGQHRYFVAEVDREVVGFGSVAPNEGELRAVYVSPDHGGHGIGGMLLQHLECTALSTGCRHLWLDASLNAEAFYAKHGYVSLGREIHKFRSGGEIACIKMEKSLTTASIP